MTCTMESPTQKFGYLDVKQSAKVKGRKLKTWKRRWVVLTKMTDMSSDQIVAKIDIYDNEATWRANSIQKTTFVLDHVTSIGQASSRTHPYAFEVCQKMPELVFSGDSEIDTFSWILVLQQIFTPHLVEERKDSFQVTIQQNADASRWSLRGDYCLAISTACVSLSDLDTGNCYISWGLSTLMRFKVTKDASTGNLEVLVIECGRNGPTGESTFGFISPEASNIMNTIRLSICQALSQKQTARGISVRPRDRSISESNSEKHFRSILDNSPFQLDIAGRDRAGSGSSCCTLTPTSPVPSNGIDNPLTNLANIEILSKVMTSRRSNVELASLDESDEQECEEQGVEGSHPTNTVLEKQDDMFHHHRHSSLPNQKVAKSNDPGYAVITEVAGQDTRSRRNTISTDDSETTSDSNTYVHDVVRPPAPKKRTSTFTSSKRTVSFENKDERSSDVDSAVSSLTLSSSVESTKLKGDYSKLLHVVDNSVEDVDSEWDCEPPPGLLNRRRSSSTPDLQAFWKHQSSLENVYEELDAIRSAVKSHNQSPAPKEIPPALPARPFNLILPSSCNDHAQTISRLKKSFFFHKPKLHRGKSMHSVCEPQPCTCNYPYISNRGFLLSKGNNVMCGQCGGSMTTNDDDVSSKIDPTPFSSNSSLNNPYSSISDVNKALSKRRRLSDVTQTFSQEAAQKGHTPLGDSHKSSSVPRNISEQSKDTYSSGSLKFDVFTNSRYGDKNNPLISFFVDDDKFQSNPMVTGELAGSQQLHNSTDLLISLDSPKETSQFFPDGIIFNTQTSHSVQTSVFESNGLQSGNSIGESFSPNTFTTTSHDIPISPVTYTSLIQTTHTPNSPISPWNNNKCTEPQFPLNSDITRKTTAHSLSPFTMLSPAYVQSSSAMGFKETPTSESSIYFSMQTVFKDCPLQDPILTPMPSITDRDYLQGKNTGVSNGHTNSANGDLFNLNVNKPPGVIFSTQISEDNTYIAPGSFQQRTQFLDLSTNTQQ